MKERHSPVGILITFYIDVLSLFLHTLEALPKLGSIDLLKVLCVLIAELEIGILYCFLDPRFAAETNDGADALLDSPSCRNTCHADIVLLGDLFNALNNLLVNGVFP